jgi:hypothetical protein
MTDQTPGCGTTTDARKRLAENQTSATQDSSLSPAYVTPAEVREETDALRVDLALALSLVEATSRRVSRLYGSVLALTVITLILSACILPLAVSRV